MAERCKPESFREEVAEHKKLWRDPKFRKAVEAKRNGKSEKKAISGRR